MTHVLEGYDHIILSGHVVRQVMIDNQSEEFVQESKVDLIVELFELGLHKDDALVLRDIPDIRQIVDTLAPFVDEEGGWLRITRLDPVREEVTLVCFVPEVLV